jgi:hypothetical protein
MSLINEINYPLIHSVGGIDYAREILKYQGVSRPEKYFDLEKKRYTVDCPPKWVTLSKLKLEVAEFDCGQKHNWVHPSLYGYAKTMYGIGKIVKFYHRYGIIWADLAYEDGITRRSVGIRNSGHIQDFEYLPDYVVEQPQVMMGSDDDDEEDYYDRLRMREDIALLYAKLSDRSKRHVDSLIDHLYNLEN